MTDIFSEEGINPTGIIEFKNINKKSLGEISGGIVQKVVSGNEDALAVYIKAKALAEISSKIIKDTKELALDEAEKYGTDSNRLGCSFTIRSGKTTYAFEHDQTWSTLNSEILSLKAKLKEREEKMIDATRYAEVVDEETGEVIPPATIEGTGASVLAVTIPRE